MLNSKLRKVAQIIRGAKPFSRSGAAPVPSGEPDQHDGESEQGRRQRRRRLAEPRIENAYPEQLKEINGKALARRPFLRADYEFRPVSLRDRDLRRLKRKHPYFGYISVEIEDIEPFVMFSNNDDPAAQVYFWYGPNQFESLSLRFWRELVRTSTHVFDVGAFTGVYALATTRTSAEAQVYCFEPIGGSLSRLLVNLAVNPQTQNVKTFKAAVGDTDGSSDMKLFKDPYTLSASSSLVPKGDKQIVSRENVQTIRLDTFVRDHNVAGVDLVKVDVERAEKMVVAGMPDILRNFRPHLLVEVFGQENLHDIVEMLPSYNFAVINDLEQEVYVNEPKIPEDKALNVLFSPGSSGDLRDFCASLEPLPPPRTA